MNLTPGTTRAIFAASARLGRGITVKNRPDAKSAELEKLYQTYQAAQTTLEWRQHVLSKKASEVKTDKQTPAQPAVRVTKTPSADFELSKERYLEEGSKASTGQANVVDFGGASVSFVSTYFGSIPFASLWKMLTAARPDVIVMQLRPDLILSNFRVNMYAEDGSFREADYLRQLRRRGRSCSKEKAGR